MTSVMRRASQLRRHSRSARCPRGRWFLIHVAPLLLRTQGYVTLLEPLEVHRSVGGVDRHFGASLFLRLDRYRGLSIALSVSLLAHLVVALFLVAGKWQSDLPAVSAEARLQVALKMPGTEGLVRESEQFVGETRSSSMAGQSVDGLWPYFSPDKLTQKPRSLEEIEIDLPEGLLLSGKVHLRLFIGADGVVERVELAESQLPIAYGEVASQAFHKRRFSPGRIGNKAVPTFTELEVEFNPAD